LVRPERGESLKAKVFELWVKNPYITASRICKYLQISYKKHGNYINRLLSEFRTYSKLGLPQKPLKHLPHKRVFHWNVPRDLLYDALQRMNPSASREFYQGLGWVAVKNRNGMLVFRETEIHKCFYEKRLGRRVESFKPYLKASHLGSVHWYANGKVILYLKGAVLLARAKELFCKAFWFLTDEQLDYFTTGRLVEKEKHWVFDLGTPVPRFDIRQFERSHGIRIFVDGSHPTAIEVRETEPFWIGELREATVQFGKEIEAHMELIKLWREEAQARRKQGFLNRIKRLFGY
jgi:hypothetical protein